MRKLNILQVSCYPSPLVYGQSHYKKFWLRQTETEDETAVAPQHVANCSQKFSTLSSSFSPMAGSPSQAQNQAVSCKAGTSTPSTNASLAACANSFNAPRPASVALEVSRSTNKGVPEYLNDLNQFEDSSEPGAVDCTLSLGTVKRERSEAAVPTGVSRSGSPAFGDVAHAYYNPQTTWSAGCSEPQILFSNRNFPSDCTRDLYPQTTVPARQSRLASGSQNHLYCGSVGSPIEGTKTSSFPRPKKSALYAGEKGVGGGENCTQGSYRGLGPGVIGLCRNTTWIPSLVISEPGPSENNNNNNKYCETPSPFNTSLIASPISGHSSVNGDESGFQQRSSILELGGNGASSSKTVSLTCAHCGTQKTPLWRNGPDGPKSLCNACGIRFKKLGKKNPSNGSSSELGSSLPSSPQSGKIRPAKAGKRKKNSEMVVGVSKQSWAFEDRRGLDMEAPTQPWKRNRSSSAVRLELTERLVETTTTESSGSEADENETGGSSGNSCLTWQHQRLNAAVVGVPSASSHAFAPAAESSERALDDFIKIHDASAAAAASVFAPAESLYKREVTRAPEPNVEDTGTINAEEAAICLVNMSHGFGLRL